MTFYLTPGKILIFCPQKTHVGVNCGVKWMYLFQPENSRAVDLWRERPSVSLKLCWADTKSSVTSDGEITPAAQPNPFACLRRDITINTCSRTGFTAVFCPASGRLTIGRIPPRLKPARRRLSPLGFSRVSLRVRLCVRPNTATSAVCHARRRLKVVPIDLQQFNAHRSTLLVFAVTVEVKKNSQNSQDSFRLLD